MKIQIEIKCESINELYGHLTIIKKQLRQVERRMPMDTDPQRSEFPVGTEVNDDNCYGSHDLVIMDDDD